MERIQSMRGFLIIIGGSATLTCVAFALILGLKNPESPSALVKVSVSQFVIRLFW